MSTYGNLKNLSDEFLALFTFLPFSYNSIFYFFFALQEIVDMCDYAVGLSRQINGSIIPSERELSHYITGHFLFHVSLDGLVKSFKNYYSSLMTIYESFSIGSSENWLNLLLIFDLLSDSLELWFIFPFGVFIFTQKVNLQDFKFDLFYLQFFTGPDHMMCEVQYCTQFWTRII